jgi:hypothetical protein
MRRWKMRQLARNRARAGGEPDKEAEDGALEERTHHDLL